MVGPMLLLMTHWLLVISWLYPKNSFIYVWCSKTVVLTKSAVQLITEIRIL